MAYKGQTVLAVVPARGGSKGIPRKNLCEVGGITLVGRVGELAKSLDWLDARVLSTDDEEIAAEGRAHGLDTPFMRPPELAGDMAKSIDMWQHAWCAAEEHYGMRFDLSIQLEPTSPLRRSEDVVATVAKLIEDNCGSAATISPAPGHFTPHKCLTVTNGQIGFYHPDGPKHTIRQTIPTYYFRNGICYAATRKSVLEDGAVIGNDCAAVIIDRPIVNIDDPFDLELAEFILQRENQ